MEQRIREFCRSIGLDTIGFIPCRKFDELREFYDKRKERNLQNEFEEQDIELRINPAHYMASAKTIISIAFPYYEKNGENCKENGFSVYTKRFDYHRVVRSYLDKICEYIEEFGATAMAFVDSNTLPERYIAYLAGVGFIGKNNMIITKQYGSYVFLGEILTDLKINCKDKRSFEQIERYIECEDCEICRQECPTKSINTARINPNICLSYLTQKKELNKKEMSLLKGNIFGCDFCQLQCPYNVRVMKEGENTISKVLPEFQMLDYMNEDIATYANMDNRFFKDKISKTSCGWRGKNVIKRNAIIALCHENGECDLEQYRTDSPYINGYIDRLKE